MIFFSAYLQFFFRAFILIVRGLMRLDLPLAKIKKGGTPKKTVGLYSSSIYILFYSYRLCGINIGWLTLIPLRG
jgi:hypothetical protein